MRDFVVDIELAVVVVVDGMAAEDVVEAVVAVAAAGGTKNFGDVGFDLGEDVVVDDDAVDDAVDVEDIVVVVVADELVVGRDAGHALERGEPSVGGLGEELVVVVVAVVDGDEDGGDGLGVRVVAAAMVDFANKVDSDCHS